MKSRTRSRGARARSKCPIAIHCHNDSEVAVANTHRGGARRRDAGAGHHQRGRRAMRQRQSRLDHPRTSAQARLPMRSAREAEGAARSLDAGLRAGEYHAIRAPGIRRPAAPSRTRAGCTSRRSCATPRPTSTSIRRWSATIATWFCRSSPARPTSCTRARSSASRSIPQATKKSATLLEEVKRLESEGYTFEGADASFELLMLRTLGMAQRAFQLRQLPRVRRQVA